MKSNWLVAVCLLVLSGLWATSLSAQAGPGPRVPKGIYTNFLLNAVVNGAETAAYPGNLPAYPNPAADAILVKYFTTLLDHPAISGLAPQIPWDLLNPNDPGFSSSARAQRQHERQSLRTLMQEYRELLGRL
jgi:hypothetical protein